MDKNQRKAFCLMFAQEHMGITDKVPRDQYNAEIVFRSYSLCNKTKASVNIIINTYACE